jgi:hypothetical protein
LELDDDIDTIDGNNDDDVDPAVICDVIKKLGVESDRNAIILRNINNDVGLLKLILVRLCW